jgi:two-component system sensor histidine kinase KdpD
MKEKRRSPEELLKIAQQEEREGKRGKLRIYLGAAPGVGKTYAMLQDAQDKREKGLDIVIGVVETHGRREIEELLKGLEKLPRQTVNYRGVTLSEFDLDGALKRNPGIILIDEMAHTNAPGLRHEKRWQDINELLDRGIDVYTTVNIQHIESRRDDVAKILHVQIKESVPDSLFEAADSIELVDIPPEDLLKRLKEGKVYFPEQAELAKDKFFREGNLIALREIALRYTADRVGAEVLSYRRGKGIKRVWPTRAKMLVCVGPGESRKLIHSAGRIAKSLNAEWTAIYVDVPRQGSEEDRHLAVQKLRLAERLGARTHLIVGDDIVKEIINFAREQNISQIMIWKKSYFSWRDYLKLWKYITLGRRGFSFTSLADAIVRQCGEIDVYVMTGGEKQEKEPVVKPVKKKFDKRSYIFSVSVVCVATLVNYLLYPYLNVANLIVIYFIGVFLVAINSETLPTILAAVLSFLITSFLFLPTNYSITHKGYLISYFLLLITVIVVNRYTVLYRKEASHAQDAERRIIRLHELSRQLATTRGVDNLLTIGVKYIGEIFESEVQALLPENTSLKVHAKSSTSWIIDTKDLGLAKWVFDQGQVAGLGTDTLPYSQAIYIPLVGSEGTLGVLCVQPKGKKDLFSPEQRHLLEAFAHQLAITIEADLHHEQAQKTKLQKETTKLRSSILESISEDLRKPLFSIMGAANKLLEGEVDTESQKIQQLHKNIFLESEQLDRLINNLLKMNYFDSDSIPLNKEFYSIKELIDFVLESPSIKMLKQKMTVRLPDDLPQVPVDKMLIQEVLHNLIDNAAKFTPPDTEIDISAQVLNDQVVVSIEDQGPGLLSEELTSLFDKFYRGRMVTIERGMGLGLAVCRTLVNAHGGKIWAENRENGGAVFRFSLPYGVAS